LSGDLFTNFGRGKAKDGEFLQKLDPEWVRFERYWQFCSLPARTPVAERQFWPCRSFRDAAGQAPPPAQLRHFSPKHTLCAPSHITPEERDGQLLELRGAQSKDSNHAGVDGL